MHRETPKRKPQMSEKNQIALNLRSSAVWLFGIVNDLYPNLDDSAYECDPDTSTPAPSSV